MEALKDAAPSGSCSSLVPRTRSSHHNCRESDCELWVQSGTRIIDLLVSFDSEVRFGARGNSGELRNRDTRLRANLLPVGAPRLGEGRLGLLASRRGAVALEPRRDNRAGDRHQLPLVTRW